MKQPAQSPNLNVILFLSEELDQKFKRGIHAASQTHDERQNIFWVESNCVKIIRNYLHTHLQPDILTKHFEIQMPTSFFKQCIFDL